MPSNPADQPVLHPTYNGNIKAFFNAGEIRCMSAQGIDLGSYEGVRRHATDIYEQTKVGNMPLGGPRWSAAWVQTFLNWIETGFPLGPGQAASEPGPVPAPAGAVRLRKNVNALSADEIALLKRAFVGIMAKDPAPGTPIDKVDPQSYFGITALHGLPLGYCMHHVDSYNPWHRRYMLAFEDALRAIPGCADVTLPYWDINQPPPALLYDAPFASYTLPVGIGDDQDYPAGYVTQRYDPATIVANLGNAPSVASDIADALGARLWGAYDGGGFQQYIIEGHDDGHNACGPTMSDQTVAAYDPIFWFFHCNWERLWQSWQVLADATELPGFTATLAGNTDWLPLALDPYNETSAQTVSWPQVTYDALAAAPANPHPLMAGHALAASAFAFTPDDRVSLRVKGIDRMNISGTFVVKLLADGEQIGRRAFFQPRSPRECTTCRRHSLVNIDFRLPRDAVTGRTLSVAIEAVAHEGAPAEIPLDQVGNPTVNARLLLEGE